MSGASPVAGLCFAALALMLAPAALAQTYRDSGGTAVPGFAQAGTKGRDYSANPPALPSVGANFSASGPYANYVLIQTIPASATRIAVDIENTSGAQIAIVRDDGSAANGAAPANASAFALGPGAAAGAQGGSWTSQTFKGRVQIYAPSSTAFVAAFAE